MVKERTFLGPVQRDQGSTTTDVCTPRFLPTFLIKKTRQLLTPSVSLLAFSRPTVSTRKPGRQKRGVTQRATTMDLHACNAPPHQKNPGQRAEASPIVIANLDAPFAGCSPALCYRRLRHVVFDAHAQILRSASASASVPPPARRPVEPSGPVVCPGEGRATQAH
ncbi:hypothetical protein BKA80DRAFT_139665 [Phyllosticta citrichinensis]